METKKLIRKLYKKYPTKIAKKYHDYVGVMVNCLPESVNKIVLCLDVTKKVIEEAISQKADLIISHHPFLYGKKSFILKNDERKKQMYDTLLANKISVYSFHTNFDEGKDGMNDALSEALELENIQPFEKVPMGRKGSLKEEMDIDDFAHYALKKLNLQYGQLIKCGKQKIKNVGIIGGSGARDAFTCLEDGIDIFLSGDTPYHIRKELQERNLNYLHVDHEVEIIFCKQMKKVLLSIDPTLEIIIVNDVKQIDLITL